MKRLFIVLALLFSASLPAQAPTAVPIAKEPHHHLVLENDYVRVFRVSVPAHDATLLHQHDVPYLYISLGPADVINAVQGRPEARIVMTDGQLGYSPGHFAHIARNESGLDFNNVTIELLHPQGEVRNLCEKIIGGPLNCLNSEPSLSSAPSHKPNTRFSQIKKLFETDEIVAELVSLTGVGYIQSGPQPSQLFVACANSELHVTVHGRPSVFLHGGEVLWLPSSNPPTLTGSRESNTSCFLIFHFKNN